MSKLKGKVALVTGASSGIGAATAIMLSKHGATLAISGRNEENLNKTAGLCQVTEDQQPPLIIQGNRFSMVSNVQNCPGPWHEGQQVTNVNHTWPMKIVLEMALK